MTPRERVLAIGVGTVILAAVGNYGFYHIRKGFQLKDDRISALESDIVKRQTIITNGLFDRKRLEVVSGRSLPSDGERAQADFTEWLNELTELSGLAGPKWSFNNRAIPEAGVYKRYSFSVTGVGTIENVNQLLYNFYEKDYLHRVTSMKISPIANAINQLNVSLSGEILSLDVASSKQAPPDWISPRVSKTQEEYRQILAMRNLYGPQNHLPQWPEAVTIQAIQGVPLAYSPVANDEDEGQTLRYDVLSELPKGMSVSNDGDKINWVPSELGKVELELVAIDSGIPQGWTTQKLVIDVVAPPKPVEPPPPPPTFDIASQAEVSAFVTGRNGPEAWVRSKLEGKTLQLKADDDLTLGDVKGKVVKVGANYMEVETDGKRWTVGLDESLADAYKRMTVN